MEAIYQGPRQYWALYQRLQFLHQIGLLDRFITVNNNCIQILCPSLFEIDAYFLFYPFEIAATVPRVLHLSLVGVEKRPEPADPYHLSDKTDPKKGSELSLVGCSELITGRQGLDCGASNVIRKDSHHQRYGIVWPHLLDFFEQLHLDSTTYL